MAIMSAGFSSAMAGLDISKKALEVTAHNLSNAETKGYSRQRVNLGDARYTSLGNSGLKEYKIGSGVSIQDIAQIRNMFLDISYREEASTKKYYEARVNGVEEFEAVLGETVLGTSFATVMSNLWNTMQELSKAPEGIENRGSFVQSAALFVEQASNTFDQFKEYQKTLDRKAMGLVDEVNSLTQKIADYNKIIVKEEASGQRANDYRDERNMALDRLSEIISITSNEDINGMVNVNAEGYQVVNGTSYGLMETRVIGPDAPFERPYWKDTNMPVYSDGKISVEKGNDKGELKGVLIMRGDYIPDYTYLKDPAKFEKIKEQPLLKTMAQFDFVVNNVVEKLNGVVNPATGRKPFGLDGSQGINLFSKIDSGKGWTATNIKVNDEVKNNVSKLCLQLDKDAPSDRTIVNKMLDAWNEKDMKITPGAKYSTNVSDFYNQIIGDLGSAGNEAKAELNNQTVLLYQISNQRESSKGVSSDEELANMIRFQQAYNANAKVISVIDKMVETLITTMIR